LVSRRKANQWPRCVLQNAIIDAAADVSQWSEATEQESRAAALYHDPRIQNAAAVTGRNVEWYRQRPGEAIKALRDLQRQQPELLDAELFDTAMDIAYAARLRFEERGIEEPGVFDPVPTSAAVIDAEIAELRDLSIRGTLTDQQDRRYNQLLGARLDKEQAAEIAALEAPEPRAHS
jgi:hypothetical protein